MKQLLAMMLIFSSTITSTEIIQEKDPLLQLAHTVQGISAPISNWEITIKEKITSNDKYDEIVDDLTQSPSYEKRDGHMKGADVHETTEHYGDIILQHQVVSQTEDTGGAERTITVKGENFNTETRKAYERLRHRLFEQISTKNSRVFSCIKFIDDGTIGNESVLKQIAKNLDILHSEMQEETVENSMVKNVYYGYTPIWEQSFTIDGQAYNLQVAVVELENEEIEYTIGTPILMNEY